MKRLILPFLLALGLTACGDSPSYDSDGWLLGADSDRERFENLESYLGGFSYAMWEVGHRYEGVYEALERDNFELAAYHWDKIGSAITGGYMKRPGRQANSDAIFMDEVWGQVQQDIESGDSDRAWTGFETGRAACMACHVAEDVSYMNDQPLFELRAPDERG